MTGRWAERHGLAVALLDDISHLSAEHGGAVVVSGSHGGLMSGRHAIRYPPRLAVFNDAGVGKDRAGIAALEQLDSFRIPAVAVAAHSARLGDADDTLEHGVISHLNSSAAALGLTADVALAEALRLLTDE